MKVGIQGNKQWKEQWYKKIKAYSLKRDEDTGLVLKDPKTGEDLYESDGSQIDESNCEKWGKNGDE